MAKTPWPEKWEVTGSNGDLYTVARRPTGEFGCSCPGWRFRKAPKPDCKHIRAIKQTLACDAPSVVKEAIMRPQFACFYCGSLFFTERILKAHFAICQAREVEKILPQFQCALCNLRFGTQEERTAHTVKQHSTRVWNLPNYTTTDPEAPKPQEVQVNGDRFSIVRKFKFTSE